MHTRTTILPIALGVLAASCLVWSLGAAEPAAVVSTAAPPDLAAGQPVDVAPWGEVTSTEGGKAVQLWWEDPRDVFRLEVTFAAQVPPPGDVRLQWWQSDWPDHRVPRDQVAGAGESGWLQLGDTYRGQWRDADAELRQSGATWTYTFRALNAKEFTNLKDFPAPYRTTQQLRLLFPGKAAAVKRLRAFTDSTWKAAEMVIEWGGEAKGTETWDGQLEGFNSYATGLKPLSEQAGVKLTGPTAWISTVQGATAGVRGRFWYVSSPNANTFDKAVMTVRAKAHSFSFDPAEVAAGKAVFAPTYGVQVRRADSPATYARAKAAWEKRTEKPLYERVFDEPEQTYARAWSEMPPRRQFYLPVGTEGGRQRFGVNPDGSVFCVNDRIDEPRGKDSGRQHWGGHRLTYGFGLPDGAPARRSIEDGCLPMINTAWEKDGIEYAQTAFVTRLDGAGLGFPDMHADDTAVLLVKITGHNKAGEYRPASVALAIEADGKPMELSYDKDLAYVSTPSGKRLRCLVEVQASAQSAQTNGQVHFFGNMPPGTDGFMVVKIPFITLDRPEEIEQLRNLEYDQEFKRVKKFWKERADAGAQITTPETPINDFYRAHVSHLMINCGREVGSDRLMARVGGFAYGVYGNESCMMITDLDRRGYHREAAQCLETFLQYQGTVNLPGNYSNQDGVFNGANGWEQGGYNQHHGWIMWAMAEHYWYSGDRAWLEKNAAKLIKACDWITTERARSRDLTGLRAIERGLLPPGSLEDIGDWRCWLSNNNFSWWGLDCIARALADIGHPRAAALQAEADAYRKDMLAAFREAMVRAPMVGLRDGTSIPQIPAEVHRRGRAFGWITVTLEGPIYLIRTGTIRPDDPMAVAIMQDYEDNLYLSEGYGYSPKHLPYWFSRGGISMQPNLLCSPHPYLMRDEIKHYLRAYFNGYAACYYPDTRMMCEHPLPDLGDWRGDHYKSSDEANSTYWLRMMFIDERDPDLYLGMAIPRAWLKDGEKPGIERAATHFGPMSLTFESEAAKGIIRAQVTPPTRRLPKATFLRFRHPEQAAMSKVTVNGQPWTDFDAKREWVKLPALKESATVVVEYAR